MAAKVKEAVIHANLRHPQKRCKPRGELLLDRVSGRDIVGVELRAFKALFGVFGGGSGLASLSNQCLQVERGQHHLATARGERRVKASGPSSARMPLPIL